MKKLIFTALAVVAFSGVSMASTKEVKPTVKVIVKANPCKDVFSSALSHAYAAGFSDEEAWAIADMSYSFCEYGIGNF